TTRGELVHLERWIERITDKNRMQKSAGLLQKRLQRLFDHVRKQSSPGDRLNGDQISERQQVGHAARPTEFEVIVDRVVVTACRLKRQKDRLGHGPAG